MSPQVSDATPEDLKWLEFHNLEIQKMGDYLIASADKYSDIFTAINAIYAGLLAFIGLTNSGVLKNIVFPLSLIFLIPIFCWIIAIFCFFQVKQPYFTSYSPDSPDEIRKAVSASNIAKAGYYQKGLILFGIGILFMVIPLTLGLYITTVPDSAAISGKVQLVIGNEYVEYLKQVPVDFVPGTNKTEPVSLVKISDTVYRIKTQNGDQVDINKTWVEILIKNGS